MDREQRAMQKPGGNRGRPNQHAGVSREQSPEDRRTMFKNAQHVEEEMRPTEIHDQQNWRKDCSTDGCDPHGRARKIDMMTDNRSACDYGRHSGHSAEEKVERNLPRPNRRFDDGLAIVTRLSRNRAAGNIDAFAWNNALLPRLLAQFFESLFGWRIRSHEKNAKPTSVAMIDAIAVAKAEVHADFK